ncbi:hypothetical protein PSAB6_60040 [Paraburkholderia sabiae]|nr:hypothetical protein PSAB6_60040 [Paraburkholderia sabiae]
MHVCQRSPTGFMSNAPAGLAEANLPSSFDMPADRPYVKLSIRPICFHRVSGRFPG